MIAIAAPHPLAQGWQPRKPRIPAGRRAAAVRRGSGIRPFTVDDLPWRGGLRSEQHHYPRGHSARPAQGTVELVTPRATSLPDKRRRSIRPARRFNHEDSATQVLPIPSFSSFAFRYVDLCTASEWIETQEIHSAISLSPTRRELLAVRLPPRPSALPGGRSAQRRKTSRSAPSASTFRRTHSPTSAGASPPRNGPKRRPSPITRRACRSRRCGNSRATGRRTTTGARWRRS